MVIEPMGDNIIVKTVNETEERAKALGIELFGSTDKPNLATVVAVGNLVKVPVAAGDKILFTIYGGTNFELDGEKLIVISSADVICKYSE